MTATTLHLAYKIQRTTADEPAASFQTVWQTASNVIKDLADSYQCHKGPGRQLPMS